MGFQRRAPLLPMHSIAPGGLMRRDVALGAFPERHVPRRGFQGLPAQRFLLIKRINAVEEKFPIFQALVPRLCQTDERARTQPDVPAATPAAVFPLKAE